MDLRHIGGTVHLWTAFHSLSVWAALCRLQRAPDHSAIARGTACRSIKGAFPGVTLSFHLLEYQFYKSVQKLLSFFCVDIRFVPKLFT